MSYIETLHGPVLRFDLSLTLQFIQSKSAGGEGQGRGGEEGVGEGG